MGPSRYVALLALAALGSCARGAVEHQAVPRSHTPEYFSFASIDVVYPEGLGYEQERLLQHYRPLEEVAGKVRTWAEETGMWGGSQVLRLELHSVRLPARWSWDQYGPLVVGTSALYRGEDHLHLGVDVLQDEERVHHIDLERTFPVLSRTLEQQFSARGAMDDLTADVAWQVVFELTPPGYDEAIIRAGHRDGVAPATVVAKKRGLLGAGELIGAAAKGRTRESSLTDTYCASVLAKPSWMPLWLWTDKWSYESCQERAEEDARRH